MEEKIAAEAGTLYAALDQVAEQLGLTRDELDYDFDQAHFRENNRNKAVETIKIFAWKKPEQDLSGVNIGLAWLGKFFSLVDIEANISYKLSENNISLQLSSEKGALIVGRKGSTLREIQAIFLAAMAKDAPEWNFRLDVAGGRKEREEKRPRERERSRDDKKGRNKGTGNLEKLAKQLAKKALEDQEVIVMRQTLNAFERRVVHQIVNDMEGVQTESFMDDGVKRIRIKPVSAASEASDNADKSEE